MERAVQRRNRFKIGDKAGGQNRGQKTLNIRTPDDRAGGGLRFFERRTIALRNASGLLNTGSAVGLLDLPTKIAIRSPRALRVAAAWGHLGARRCSLEAVRYRA